jgi:hypothetical protein
MVVVLDLWACERALLETSISHRVGPTCLSSPYMRVKGSLLELVSRNVKKE